MTGVTVAAAMVVLALAVRRAVRYGRLVKEWTGAFAGVVRTVTLARSVLLGVAAACGTVAAVAGTVDGAERVRLLEPPVMFVIDVSLSMEATDTGAMRRTMAEGIVRAALQDTRLLPAGLIAVAGEAVVVCPPTADGAALALALDEIPAAAARLAGGSILAAGVRLARDAAAGAGVIVLLSDGEDTQDDAGAIVAEAAEGARMIHTVGVGSREGAWLDPARAGARHLSRLDEALLRALAHKTRGDYLDASSSTVVSDLQEAIGASRSSAHARSPSDGGSRWWLTAMLAALVCEALLGKVVA